MPRYHFHLENSVVIPDETGADLVDIHAARVQAVRSLSEIINEHRELFWDNQPVRVVVTDEAGLMLFVIEASAFEAPVLTRFLPG
jgi:hypothetical protein